MKDNPYVGPRPYERGEARKFYGRNREARDLLALLLAERAVLFYAKSGAGKTSLLNARVIPALEAEDFAVLPIARVGGDVPPGLPDDDVDNVFVLSALMSLAGENVAPEDLRTYTLTSFLQAFHLHPDEGFENDQPFLLIVDQFEELFTTHRDRWEDAKGFFAQVRDALDALPSMGILFAMREDYVAELDPYVPLLPKRLRARFRMELLGRAGALEAITRPALERGIAYGDGVAERLVDDLRRIRVQPVPGVEGTGRTMLGPFIEPVQLQVVCSRLWENLPEQEDRTIQWEEVQEFGRIDRALIDFYRTALDAAVAQTGVSMKALRRWFGEELITPMQTRGLVLRGPEKTGSLPNAAVDVLSRHYIIRSEVRAGARWYELSHDRLVDPILRSNRGWEAQRQTPLRMAARSWQQSQDASLLYHGKALEEALRWLEEHPEDAEPEELEFLAASRSAEQMRRRRRRVQVLATFLGGMALLLIAFLAWDAERSRLVAYSRESAADALYFYQAADQVKSLYYARQGVLIGDPTYRGADAPFWRPLLGTIDTVRAQNALRQALVDFYPSQILTDLGANPYTIVFSADGHFLYGGMDNRRLRVWAREGNKFYEDAVLTTPGANWSLAFSPDDRYLAVGGDSTETRDGVVGILDVVAREWKAWLVVPTSDRIHDDVYAVAFSPDGYYVATGGDYDAAWRDYSDGMANGIVRIWELGQRGDTLLPTAVLTLTAPTARVNSVAFSPMPPPSTAMARHAPYHLAAASNDGTVRIWQITPRAPGNVEADLELTLKGHTDRVLAVAYSPTEDILASASADKTIRLWNQNTGKALLTLTGHTAEVKSIAFSADGRYLISGSRDLTVRVWDVMARNPNPLVVLKSGPKNVVLAVAFSPDKRFLVAGTADNSLRVWDQGFVAQQGLSTLGGHQSRVRGIAYSPDGLHLASSDDDGWTRIWSLETGETLHKFAPVGKTVWNLAYSPDGQYLVTCAEDDNAYVWDALSYGRVATLAGHAGDVEDAAFSGDGRYLVTGGDDHKGIIWNTTTWEPEAELVIPGNAHPGWALSVAYSSDNRWIATGYTGGGVTLWRVTPSGTAIQATPVVTFTEHTGYVMGLAFSPDDAYLASASWDGTVRIWSTETLTSVLDTPLHHPNDVFVYSVAFSPDGAYLATGARDGRVRFWDMRNFPDAPPKLVAELGGHTDLVWSISFSPDGKHLASGSWDRTIRRYLVPFDDVWALAEFYIEGVPLTDASAMMEVRP